MSKEKGLAQRGLKYRAWCKVHSKLSNEGWTSEYMMCEVASIHFKTGKIRVKHTRNIHGRIENTSSDVKMEDYELMPYTGLNASGEQEIYVGDLYVPPGYNSKLYVVTLKNGAVCGGLVNKGDAIPLAWDPQWGEDGIEPDTDFCSTIKVVGNIYENPELCQEKK